mmetsp:Transcript_125857/g.298773  ORF Transcript_125857/g.298773 Transcript_125857/m.298773 type:complete len:537 (+) Transcript_125857:391-2001(+)
MVLAQQVHHTLAPKRLARKLPTGGAQDWSEGQIVPESIAVPLEDAHGGLLRRLGVDLQLLRLGVLRDRLVHAATPSAMPLQGTSQEGPELRDVALEEGIMDVVHVPVLEHHSFCDGGRDGQPAEVVLEVTRRHQGRRAALGLGRLGRAGANPSQGPAQGASPLLRELEGQLTPHLQLMKLLEQVDVRVVVAHGVLHHLRQPLQAGHRPVHHEGEDNVVKDASYLVLADFGDQRPHEAEDHHDDPAVLVVGQRHRAHDQAREVCQLVQGIGRDARNQVQDALGVAPLLRQGQVADLHKHAQNHLWKWRRDVAGLLHELTALLRVVAREAGPDQKPRFLPGDVETSHLNPVLRFAFLHLPGDAQILIHHLHLLLVEQRLKAAVEEDNLHQVLVFEDALIFRHRRQNAEVQQNAHAEGDGQPHHVDADGRGQLPVETHLVQLLLAAGRMAHDQIPQVVLLGACEEVTHGVHQEVHLPEHLVRALGGLVVPRHGLVHTEDKQEDSEAAQHGQTTGGAVHLQKWEAALHIVKDQKEHQVED